ncbi:MAG: Crp/Fnr family transcriptional regulator [candidate division NC10 bacterium]|nr:Crp/Fnr family transcriptional regulator [candidate division NC10 bacterium]
MDGRLGAALSLADIQSVPAFAKLCRAALGLIRRVAVTRTFQPGQMIFIEGEPSRGLWFLKEGRVRIYRMSADGREQGLCLMRAGMCCGCPLFYGETNPASAQAVETVTMYFIEADVALRLAEQDSEIGRALFSVFAKGEQILSSLLVSLSCSHLTSRLAQILLEHAEAEEGPGRRQQRPELAFGHQDLAGLLGTSREAVTRALDRLQRTGAIELGRKRIVILDRERLRAQAR